MDAISKITNLLNLHNTQGFKGCVEYLLEHIKEILEKLPNKPSPDNQIAKDELEFLNALIYEKDKNGLNIFDKIAVDWLGSGYCDICFAEVLLEFYKYVSPKELICFDREDLLLLVKEFEETNVYEPRYFYKKYKLKNGKFVIVNNKFKYGLKKNDKVEYFDIPPKKVDKKKVVKYEDTKLGIISGVISSFMKNGE